PKDVIEDMLEEQRIAHCDALPTAMLPGMAEAQQLRDAAFADAVLRLVEAGHRPVVLITGNGHARTDRGSPFYLKRAAPDLNVVSVGLIEVDGSPARAPFDAAIHTEPFDRGDPCEAFRKSREKG
ncbi:MAG: ChaN family lipoprotein, partial [Pseudomonadota bacterium]